jgi:hypothetical protein
MLSLWIYISPRHPSCQSTTAAVKNMYRFMMVDRIKMCGLAHGFRAMVFDCFASPVSQPLIFPIVCHEITTMWAAPGEDAVQQAAQRAYHPSHDKHHHRTKARNTQASSLPIPSQARNTTLPFLTQHSASLPSFIFTDINVRAENLAEEFAQYFGNDPSVLWALQKLCRVAGVLISPLTVHGC